MLLLKLLLAPALVAMATLAARRWGPLVGGIVVGLPLSAGPILLFVGLEQGNGFAAQATAGILAGLIGTVAFGLAYRYVAMRLRPALALPVSLAGYCAVGLILSQVAWTLPGAALAAYLALVVAIRLVPRSPVGGVRAAPAWWDLWVRMGAAAVLTLLLTSLAGWLGPVPTGVAASFPVVLSVVATFTHLQWGAAAAIAVIRGSVLSWFGFASFFVAAGLALPTLGLAAAFGLGAVAAVATSLVALWWDRARSRPG